MQKKIKNQKSQKVQMLLVAAVVNNRLAQI